MAFEDFESSVENAQPVYLYAFTLGTRVWRYASCALDVLTEDGFVWQASPISHDGVRQTGSAATDALAIEMPMAAGPVQVYTLNPPSSAIGVRIFQKDAVDAEVVAIYAGRVAQVNPQTGKATVTCETLSASLHREGLRLGWQRSCPYVLYDALTCKVNKAAHVVAVTVSVVNGFTIEVTGATLADGIYQGGFFEWTHPVKGLEFLAIEKQTGNQLLVFGTTVDLYPGLPIQVYRGCQRTPAACESFANSDNYGGIPSMPGKSPYDGDPVF